MDDLQFNSRTYENNQLFEGIPIEAKTTNRRNLGFDDLDVYMQVKTE